MCTVCTVYSVQSTPRGAGHGVCSRHDHPLHAHAGHRCPEARDREVNVCCCCCCCCCLLFVVVIKLFRDVKFLDYADTAQAAFDSAGGRWATYSVHMRYVHRVQRVQCVQCVLCTPRRLLNTFLCMSQIGSNAVYILFVAQNVQPVGTTEGRHQSIKYKMN